MLDNFEKELCEAFRFCDGLKLPQREYQGKISWQRVTQEPSFIMESDYYLLDSMAFLTSKSKERLLYILGFLNSKTIFYYFKNIGHLYADKGFLLSNQYVEKLPIPKITESNKPLANEIIKCVDKILEIKACHTERSEVSSIESKKDISPMAQYDKRKKAQYDKADSALDTSKLESQIDSLVYKLYNLSDDEIKIIEN
ncbi:hypothetical protein IP364_00280 [Helicobacter winghamensis]